MVHVRLQARLPVVENWVCLRDPVQPTTAGPSERIIVRGIQSKASVVQETQKDLTLRTDKRAPAIRACPYDYDGRGLCEPL